jgi:hypothetical protein
MNHLRPIVLGLLAVSTLAVAQDFQPYSNFPQQAGNPFSSPTGVALPNGRLLVWNGAEIFLQDLPGADAFTAIASGYDGDPAFAALAPDGHTVLLGAGGFAGETYLNDLYLFDSANPADFTPTAIAASTPHYAGAFLTQNLVVLEVGKSDFSGSEIQVIDLSSKGRSLSRSIITGLPSAPPRKDLVIDKPTSTYSGGIAVDPENGIVYITAVSFGAPPDQELRYFAVQDLVDAYNLNSTLDWAMDGTLIGGPNQFFGGGVVGVTHTGYLLNGGTGGVQLIDPNLSNPATASIVDTFTPGTPGGFYGAIYNAAKDDIIIIESLGQVYGPAESVKPVPAAGVAGLGTLMLLLAAAAARKHRQR